jgi:mxaA protein
VRALALSLLALLASAAAVAAEPAGVSLRMIEPRSFGYLVGDVFSREVDIVAAEPYLLEPSSLPAPGRLTYWLDLKSADVIDKSTSGGRRYRVVLTYQTFYVALAPTRLIVPGMTLKFTDGQKSVEAEVPAWSLVMAAMREIAEEKPEEGPIGYMQPDAVPTLIATSRDRNVFGAAAGGFLLSLLLLAFHQAWWPFHARPSRPFTNAARSIGHRAAGKADQDAYRASLLDLHRAFDASARRRLLAEDVPIFLAGHQVFKPLASDISRFFASSRRAFFGNDLAGAAEEMPLADVTTLGKRLGEAERRAA